MAVHYLAYSWRRINNERQSIAQFLLADPGIGDEL